MTDKDLSAVRELLAAADIDHPPGDFQTYRFRPLALSLERGRQPGLLTGSD